MIIRLISLFFLFMCSEVLAADPPMQLYDEGVLQGVIFKINCVGSGIVCTKSGITGIITVSSVTPPVSGLQFLSVDLQFIGNSLTFNP